MLLYKDSMIFLLDMGSSNCTFVNNIRLSKAGKESDPTEVFTGDIIKFGAEVADKNKKVMQLPVVARLQLFLEDGSESYERLVIQIFNIWIIYDNTCRSPSSLLFRPAESEEDVTVVDDDDNQVNGLILLLK